MENFLNQLVFGWYPYLAVTVLIVGSILRFDADQSSWRSQSSQFLRRKQLMWGSNLMHLGIIVLFFGHLIGLMTPVNLLDAVGIGHGLKQMTAMVVGGIAGLAALMGATLLLHRRLLEPRIRQSSSIGDILVLVLLWAQLILGVGTTFWTVQHLDGAEMLRFMGWAQGLATFQFGAAELIADTALVYKLHIVLGLTLFLITPFTRLVHIWSAPVWFLLRPGWQIVRSLGPARRRPATGTRSSGAPDYGGTTVLRQHSESGGSS
ncbi:MAG TPA: respiratory nitrate reductase subunit gamma [Paracoccaceae bacterium]|nr:respiratory nitrate reductase subunit gamma [Paracoccaceae bacterium]